MKIRIQKCAESLDFIFLLEYNQKTLYLGTARSKKDAWRVLSQYLVGGYYD